MRSTPLEGAKSVNPHSQEDVEHEISQRQEYVERSAETAHRGAGGLRDGERQTESGN